MNVRASRNIKIAPFLAASVLSDFFIAKIVGCYFLMFDPKSIEVDTRVIAPSVSVDDSIWVKHGDYFEYKIFS